MIDVGLTVQVIPVAVCQFITRETMPAPWPDGPGTAGPGGLIVKMVAEAGERGEFIAHVVVVAKVELIVFVRADVAR